MRSKGLKFVSEQSHALPSALRSKGLKFVSERGEFGSQFSQRSFFSGKPKIWPSYLPAPPKTTTDAGARAAGAKAAAEPRARAAMRRFMVFFCVLTNERLGSGKPKIW